MQREKRVHYPVTLIITLYRKNRIEETQAKLEKNNLSRSLIQRNIINGARNVLLTLQNTSAVKKQFTTRLHETANEVYEKSSKPTHSSSTSKTISRPAMTGFLTMIAEFQRYAVTNINIPFQVNCC